VPGFQELLVIAVVALLVFGPERLPELARSAGEMVARFRAVSQRSVDELKRVAEVEELDRELKGLRREVEATRHDVVRRMRSVGAPASPAPSPARSTAPRSRPDRDPPPFDPEAT
jgi:sec-independent protein translocase protein TatB